MVRTMGVCTVCLVEVVVVGWFLALHCVIILLEWGYRGVILVFRINRYPSPYRSSGNLSNRRPWSPIDLGSDVDVIRRSNHWLLACNAFWHSKGISKLYWCTLSLMIILAPFLHASGLSPASCFFHLDSSYDCLVVFLLVLWAVPFAS